MYYDEDSLTEYANKITEPVRQTIALYNTQDALPAGAKAELNAPKDEDPALQSIETDLDEDISDVDAFDDVDDII